MPLSQQESFKVNLYITLDDVSIKKKETVFLRNIIWDREIDAISACCDILISGSNKLINLNKKTKSQMIDRSVLFFIYIYALRMSL